MEACREQWRQRKSFYKTEYSVNMFLLQHCIINISTLWQWDGEELCTHLHEQSLLPQFLVEDENIRICPDYAWVKVHDPQTLQTPSPRQSHVSLAALKHTCQRDFHAVQCHSLKWEKKNTYGSFTSNTRSTCFCKVISLQKDHCIDLKEFSDGEVIFRFKWAKSPQHPVVLRHHFSFATTHLKRCRFLFPSATAPPL